MLITSLKKLGLLGILLVAVVVTSSVLLSYTFSVDDVRFKDQVEDLKIFSFLFLGVNLLYLVAILFLMKGLPKLPKLIFNLLIAAINIFYGAYMIYNANQIETFEGFKIINNLSGDNLSIPPKPLDNSINNIKPTLSSSEKKTKYAGYVTGSLGLAIGIGIASSTLFNL